jgi:predicted kinase
MCGPAGSGKTTWVREHATPGVSAHISRDRIRFNMVKEDEYYFSREKEVYMEFVRQICRALAYETKWVDEIYVDATHLTKKSREKLVRELDSFCPSYDLIAVIIKPEPEQCLAQNAQRSGREFVPETVIKNMYETFQHPINDDLHYEMIIENDEVIYGKENV